MEVACRLTSMYEHCVQLKTDLNCLALNRYLVLYLRVFVCFVFLPMFACSIERWPRRRVAHSFFKVSFSSRL